MRLVEEKHLQKFHRYVYECKTLKITTLGDGVGFQLDGDFGILSGSSEIYIQMGSQVNVNDAAVMLQWVEPDGEIYRYWVRVSEKIDVDPSFKLPEGAMMRC